MTISKVSFLGSSSAQIARLKGMNATLSDLTRQIASRKKHDTLADFGVDAATVQRNRVEISRVGSYLDNISAVTTRINQMNAAMTGARDAVQQVIDGLVIAVHDSTADISSIANLAKNSLAFLQDMTNLNHDGRYLFAGSDTDMPPFQDANTMNANFQAEVADWLNGTNSTAQLLSNVDGFTGADLGMNPSLGASGNVAVRIDDTSELDYTVRADTDGFQQLIRALGFMANMQPPGPGDIPTVSEANDVMTQILQIAREGLQQLDAASARVGINFNLIKSVQDTHEQDSAMLEGLISDAEDADTTEVVAQLQALQTQLQASYETTRISSQLSLINFL